MLSGRTNESPPVFYRTLSPSGLLPTKERSEREEERKKEYKIESTEERKYGRKKERKKERKTEWRKGQS